MPKKKSPWLSIGIGCGAVLLLGIVGTVVAVVVGLVQFQKDMAHPAKRTERAKEVLGAQTLPEGYYAVVAIDMPILITSAVLSTHSPDAPGRSPKEDERTFSYLLAKRSTPKDVEQVRDYLEGRSDDTSALARNNVRIRTDELIRRGTIQLDGYRLLYLAQRGQVDTGSSDKSGPGLNSILLIECPDQARLRLGFWLAPTSSPQLPVQQLDLKGTPADEDALRDFMSHFNPCQGH